ncbi:hypothetical protein GGX14DRAFT_397029 [Mycena pura]|uniref:Uncharacterized protein n=1 Tax=Mycena pura TaxID=153505 RepID=A0AAD6VDN4_9AGAR|nr:hypothetical protein GGX14DRAFT_397029 [Mycena pura]
MGKEVDNECVRSSVCVWVGASFMQSPTLRAAPLSEAAVFALCSALVVLQAVAATLLRRVDAALAGVAAGDASSGSARRAACALAGGAAGLVMASYRELEHRERESDAAGPGFAHKHVWGLDEDLKVLRYATIWCLGPPMEPLGTAFTFFVQCQPLTTEWTILDTHWSTRYDANLSSGAILE